MGKIDFEAKLLESLLAKAEDVIGKLDQIEQTMEEWGNIDLDEVIENLEHAVELQDSIDFDGIEIEEIVEKLERVQQISEEIDWDRLGNLGDVIVQLEKIEKVAS